MADGARAVLSRRHGGGDGGHRALSGGSAATGADLPSGRSSSDVVHGDEQIDVLGGR
jgi:hypothetical protein